MKNRLIGAAVCLALTLSLARPLSARAAEPPQGDLFARPNLVAWCIVPFDSKKRGPEERAAMLEKLGFSKFAYDYRAEHIPTFDQEIEALKRHKVELTAWWFPTVLNDEAKRTLEVFAKHKVTPQLWVTGGGGPTKDEADQKARVIAEAARIRPIAEAAAKVGCQVALYNHGGWFGEPENQIEIIEEIKRQLLPPLAPALRGEGPGVRGSSPTTSSPEKPIEEKTPHPNPLPAKPGRGDKKEPVAVGIVYNQHHGHDHLDRFAELLQKMKPYLLCLNLNGMVKEGDRKGQKIMQLGEGDLDLKLLKIVKDSGYTGPIGILGHTQDDAEERLHDNLDGFDWLLPQLEGKPAGPKPKMRTPVPKAVASTPLAPALRGEGPGVRGSSLGTSSKEKTPHPNPLPARPGRGDKAEALTEGKFGKGLDGRSGGALVKGRDEFRQFPITVEYWTKLADKSTYNILVAHELKSSGTHWEVFSMAGSGTFTAYLPGFAPDHCNSTTMICDDQWHHVAMVLELERVRLYVDGKSVADQKHQRTEMKSVPGDVGLATLVDHAIGCTGLVDEVRISKGVREITTAPEKPFAADDATLGLWHLDELLEQQRLDDASKNKNAALLGDARVARPESSKGVAGGRKIEGHWGTDAVGFNWTEADSVDDRFGQMDVGPFLSTSLGVPLAPAAWHDPVYKAIVVRVGTKRQASISYDTELLRATAGWTGFVRFDPARFGIIGAPRPDGPITFVTPSLPGWSLTDEFPNFRADHRYGPLPKEVAHYEGLYRHGQRVVLKSVVDGRGLRVDGQNQPSTILETPWLEETADAVALTRTLLVGPSGVSLKMMVADPKARVALHPQSEVASVAPGHGGCHVLTIEPHDKPVTIKLLIASPDANEAAFKALLAASPAPEDVLALTKPGPTIWGEPLVTKGEVADAGMGNAGRRMDASSVRHTANADGRGVHPTNPSTDGYAIDTITLPFDNPFNALLFCGGHDFLPDGRAVVCTLHGDVWLVDGIDDTLEWITWRRFATGLFHPLGVKVLEVRNAKSGMRNEGGTNASEPLHSAFRTPHSALFIVGRDQITRLHDLNNDGEADYYENFNNDAHVTLNGHEYVACLEADRAGNLYYVKGNNNSQTPHDGSLLRVSADGSKLDVFATGFRNPNGMSIGPNDEITVAPQEGEWTPASAVFDVREGGFYGMMHSHHQAIPPTDFIRPICWFSRRDDNSCGGQVWTTSDKFGPLGNQLLHMSFGQCKLRVLLREETKVETGEPGAVRPRVPVPEEPGALRHPARQDSLRPFNGGSFELPLTFASGVHRGRMNPSDGQLYLTGLKGWVSSAVNDGCFQRVRYAGATDQPQAGVIPSPPSAGERARVRGPNGDDAAVAQTDSTLPPSPRRGGPGRGAGAQSTPEPSSPPLPNPPHPGEGTNAKAPLTLTLSPEDGGEGTRRTATNANQPSALANQPLPLTMQTYSNGVALTFSGPLDREAAEDPSSYQLQAWNYKWSAEYGSPEYKPSAPGQVGRDEIEPKSATLLEDNRTVFIELPNLKPVDQLAIGYTLLTVDSKALEQTVTLTLNSIPEIVMPEKSLHRPNVDPNIAAVHGRLVPGVQVRIPNDALPMTRRLMAWTHANPLRWMQQDIRATAYLKVPATGLYRFNAEADRAGILEINGQTHSLGDEDVAIRLPRGWTRINIGHLATREFSRFRLTWESDRFPREAVPHNVLFHDPQDGGDASTQRRAFFAGRALFAEHHCTRCHVRWPDTFRGDTSETTAEARREAPRLDGIGSRLRPDWLAAWLRDPAQLRHDATMPKLHETANEVELHDLLAHLESLRDTALPVATEASDTANESPVAAGAVTFERLGCIACHTFSANAAADEWHRVSLHFVKGKFQPGRLVEFLLTPHRHHAGSRMPDFHLSQREAHQLAAYIEDRATGTVPPLAGNRVGNAERGRAFFAKWRCGHCHVASSADRLATPDIHPAFRVPAANGCLANPPSREQVAPVFTWSDSERDAIRAYVTTIALGRAPKHEATAEMLPRLTTSLRCNACHARDEQRSLWPEIVAEEGSGRAVEAVPQLTWVGEKLQGPWIEKLLKGELDGERTRRMGFQPVRSALPEANSLPKRPDGLEAHPTGEIANHTGGSASHRNDSPTKARPWLTARMPSFPAYASLIAHGMAAEHGVPFEETLPKELDADQVEIGRKLTLRDGGLDCRQCHGVGKEQPRGDASTQIALGINFALARERLRPEFALRQMLDPPRYDIGSRMPRFAPDLRTTAAKHIEGGDARKQFEALKQFLWSVNPEE